jgi:hypothetical protein
MQPSYRLTAVLASIVALAIALASPGSAAASGTQQMILQDDAQLIYSPPQQVSQTLSTLKAMGVDRVRVSVVWSLVAPKPHSSKRPKKFNPTNPAAYPTGAWFRWDYLDVIASRIGMGVYFQPTAPAPYWATPPLKIKQGYRWSHDPSAKLYGQFVQAVGTRYSGHYKVMLDGVKTVLPRVSFWGVWNEPNIGGWMTPQWSRVGGRFVPSSAGIYRGMLRAAWSALARTGHGHDTILVGETAAYGAGHQGYGASMDPLTFVRALYCLSSGYRPLTGSPATAIGCPASGNRAAFVRSNPALFEAKGWAHHPYDFSNPPSAQRHDPNSATLSGLSRIERTLDRSFGAYHKRAGIPIYITEWGVQSRDPSPFVKFSQAQQGEFINQGEYMAWHNPRVRTFAQFLLVDAGPNTNDTFGSKAYWATFQSGLLFYPSDKAKPAYYAFELPIWVPNPRHGPNVFVWAQIRPINAARVGTLQFQARGSSTWQNVASVSSDDPEGYLTTHISLPSAGLLRLSWTGPGGTVLTGRDVQIN